MDIDEVRALSDAELEVELATAKRNLYDLRFQLATRQLNDYMQIRKTRKHLARIMTVQVERQLVRTGMEAGR
jgi:large subunit ribosomal protein L29